MLDFLMYAGLAGMAVTVLAVIFRPAQPVTRDDSDKAPYKIESPSEDLE